MPSAPAPPSANLPNPLPASISGEPIETDLVDLAKVQGVLEKHGEAVLYLALTALFVGAALSTLATILAAEETKRQLLWIVFTAELVAGVILLAIWIPHEVKWRKARTALTKNPVWTIETGLPIVAGPPTDTVPPTSPFETNVTLHLPDG